MDTDAMTDYYWENLKDILQRQLADDDEYRALIQKKIAAEIALKALIGEEAWSLYLELDPLDCHWNFSRCILLPVYHSHAVDYLWKKL